MIQSNSFSGQAVFAQLVGLISKPSFNHLVKEHRMQTVTVNAAKPGSISSVCFTAS